MMSAPDFTHKTRQRLSAHPSACWRLVAVSLLLGAQITPAHVPTSQAGELSGELTGEPSPELTVTLNRLPAALSDVDFIDTQSETDSRFELGRHLFFDPVLSGNRNISCGTCHDPAAGTSDGAALSIGEGGMGKGSDRTALMGVTGRVPRNAQALYNLGAREYRSFFHDGRLDAHSTHVHGAGFARIDSERLPDNLDGLLARQALFPVVSAVEMAGQPGENAIADAVANYQLNGNGGAWYLIAERLRQLPGYVSQFQEAFDDINNARDIDYSHVAQALATFQARAFRSTDSPFDTVLKTRETTQLTELEQQGLLLFYGQAGCSGCHSGPLLTDHDFHAIAMPQIGPGKGHGQDRGYQQQTGFSDRLEDEGRYRITRNPDDHFRFRTPSLRNVALSEPWGHAGTYDTLEGIVRHHANPTRSLHAYSAAQAESLLTPLPAVLDSTGRGKHREFFDLANDRLEKFNERRGYVQGNSVLRKRIAHYNDLNPQPLDDRSVAALVAFLHTLTDPDSINQSHLIPQNVPSGLTPQPTPPVSTPERIQ